MDQIGTYVNGNTIVTMYNDGTKVRYTRDGQIPAPEFPESMDLKITNRCDLVCEMCSMRSTPDGDHADLDDPILDTIRPYTELAIGGGNPLEHPNLFAFLSRMQSKKVICNLTVNAAHFIPNAAYLDWLSENGLIHGLGISVPEYVPEKLFSFLPRFPNAVIHTIAGYTPMKVFDRLANKNLNLLVLGYKNMGSGEEYMHSHPDLIASYFSALEDKLPSMRSQFKAIAFDNLAVQQLRLRDKMSQKEWDSLYMGDDGDFTMYIDLVKHTYAASSTHKPRPIDASSIKELFQHVKENKQND